MTETPEPIRKSDLPCIPAPENEFFTWFAHPGGGGDLVPGQFSRGVQVFRPIRYGDWHPVHPGQWAEEPPSDAGPAAPATARATEATQLPQPYRQLIAQLEADRARALAAADAASDEKVKDVQSALACGYLHAILRAVFLFEGAEARKRYSREHADGTYLTVYDGPGEGR